MRKISVLDQQTIDKIAAGEVVERPSSVVKELVENSIDAGSTAVTVEIKEGGESLIRITDNGSGMEKEQIPLAFLRHATSKISAAEDLEHVSSLGFRGEALSSISAVAQVELITKTPSAMTGCRYVIEGGAQKNLEEIGAPEGSTILVHNLFFNTPARCKFLKSSMTEGNYIGSLMEQLSLSHPEISFKYIQNGQIKLHTSGNANLKDVIYHIYGRDITKEILPLEVQGELLDIRGFIGKPAVSRGNRNYENYFINGRFVKNKIITRAVEDAYKGFMMQHKFPFVVLHIQMEGNHLDVNVHPTKMEVRFSREQEVYQEIFQAVTAALSQRELILQVGLEEGEKRPDKPILPEKKEIPEPFEKKRRESFLREQVEYGQPVKSEERTQTKLPEDNTPRPERGSAAEAPGLPTAAAAPVPNPPAPDRPVSTEQPKQMELFDGRLLSEEARKRHILIGQVFDTYWLVQYQDSLYIIDQHAAHEKVLYERIMEDLRKKEIHAQYLSPPMIISLNLQEEEFLKSHRELFGEFGFEIEHFGGREFSIRAVPANLYGISEQDLFLELLDQMESDARNQSPELLKQRLATMACKAAVKGNQELSPAEADSLIDELLHLENPYHCPHGRPTIISMSKAELEKKFKRIL